MDGTRRRVESFHEDFDSKNAQEEGAGSEAVDNDPPTRARSRSVHQNDDIPPPRLVTLVDPYASQQSLQDPQQQTEGKVEKSGERSGPLKVREVLALKMGLEQVTTKSKLQLKEEEDEKRAAELEKKKRAAVSTSSPSSMGAEPPLRRFKFLLLGDSGVGKTSLILRWTMDTFSASTTGTVGVDFKAKKVCVDGDHFQIQVWDTAGQEQFHKITTSYYRGSNGIMLVYDVTDEKSASEVSYWMKNIKMHATGNMPVVMVGNKGDLLTGRDSPILTTGKNNAKKYDVPHFVTSAKDSSGVDDAFLSLVKLVVSADAQVKPKSHLAPPPSLLAKEKSEKSSTLSVMFKGLGKSSSLSSGESMPADSKGISGNNEKSGKEKCIIS